jgi:hypothetical protein
LSTYAQLDDVAAKAEVIALSYDKCREVIKERSEKLGATGHNVQLDRIRLRPGWREVILKIMFPDGKGLQVMLDVDNEIVYWVKNYW